MNSVEKSEMSKTLEKSTMINPQLNNNYRYVDKNLTETIDRITYLNFSIIYFAL